MTRRLIITSGDAAVRGLTAAGVDGVLLPWRDILYEGPAPAGLGLSELSAIRARYLAETYPVPGRDIAAEFATRDAVLCDHAAFDEVVLVFDRCFCDTLQMLQVMDFLAGTDRSPSSLRLLQTERSLDAIGPQVAAQVATAPVIGRARLTKAQAAWRAWRAPTPDSWLAMLDAPRNLRHVWLAVLVSSRHLPLVNRGITGVEDLVLDALDGGAATGNEILTRVSQRMDMVCGRYFTDWSLWTVLTGLASATVPLISGPATHFPFGGTANAQSAWRETPCALTPFGRRVHAGTADHASVNAIDLWFGGTHLTSSHLWRVVDDGRLAVGPRRARPTGQTTH